MPKASGTAPQCGAGGLAGALMDVAVIEPVVGPLDATVVPPGSKSITNRALVAAALAAGRSTIRNALVADDTEAMVDCLRRLGFGVATGAVDADPTDLTVEGSGGRVPAAAADLDVRQSGTTARFVAPVAALGHGRYRLDGAPRMRERPMADLVAALRSLGAHVDGDRLPFIIDAAGLAGGRATVAADASSQFASGLLLAGPAMTEGLELRLASAPVSRPYLELTADVMRAFGATVTATDDRTYSVAPGGYRAAAFTVEPDASAASYFFAAAAICGGTVRVPGLGRRSRQGDLAFVDVLARMGADVEQTDDTTTVTGAAPLRGVEVDMGDLSDTASTLAVVAAFASSPTRVTGIGFIRAKESDRVGGVVRELRRLGVDADEEADGFVVRPGSFHPARVHTYDDHRMAMSFALVGLRVPGVEIEDPACVAKTFPGFFSALAGLTASR
jgi:3-phosphoshikimate 1-carboxyvinyltransferase